MPESPDVTQPVQPDEAPGPSASIPPLSTAIPSSAESSDAMRRIFDHLMRTQPPRINFTPGATSSLGSSISWRNYNAAYLWNNGELARQQQAKPKPSEEIKRLRQRYHTALDRMVSALRREVERVAYQHEPLGLHDYGTSETKLTIAEAYRQVQEAWANLNDGVHEEVVRQLEETGETTYRPNLKPYIPI